MIQIRETTRSVGGVEDILKTVVEATTTGFEMITGAKSRREAEERQIKMMALQQARLAAEAEARGKMIGKIAIAGAALAGAIVLAAILRAIWKKR